MLNKNANIAHKLNYLVFFMSILFAFLPNYSLARTAITYVSQQSVAKSLSNSTNYAVWRERRLGDDRERQLIATFENQIQTSATKARKLEQALTISEKEANNYQNLLKDAKADKKDIELKLAKAIRQRDTITNELESEITTLEKSRSELAKEFDQLSAKYEELKTANELWAKQSVEIASTASPERLAILQRFADFDPEVKFQDLVELTDAEVRVKQAAFKIKQDQEQAAFNKSLAKQYVENAKLGEAQRQIGKATAEQVLSQWQKAESLDPEDFWTHIYITRLFQTSGRTQNALSEANLALNSAVSQRDISAALDEIGTLKLKLGDTAGALDAYQESLDNARKLAAADKTNLQAQRDLSISIEKIGDVKLKLGDISGALAAYQESLDVAHKLAAADKTNTEAQRDVSISLNKIGDVKLKIGDTAGALAAYQESLDVAHKLAAADKTNTGTQRDVSIALDRIGDVKLKLGDTTGALAAYQESLDIRRKLAAADKTNTEAQRDVSVSLSNIGDVKLKLGDTSGALATYKESLDTLRKLAAADKTNTEAQRDLGVSLWKVKQTGGKECSWQYIYEYWQKMWDAGTLAFDDKKIIGALKQKAAQENLGQTLTKQ